MELTPHGWHLALECSGCAAEVLTEAKALEAAMVDAAKSAGATVVESVFHRFSPHGLSGVVIIAESHLAIHTWPEHSYASVDVFTCTSESLTEEIGAHLVAALQPAQVTRSLTPRTPPS